MKKKIVSMLLCLTMVATMAVGCGSKDSGSDASADATTEETSSLVIPVSATVTSLNGILETMAEGAFQLKPFSDELYYVDQDETRFYLAESCDVSEDGLEYTLKLRDNLKWHDGEQITADKVDVFCMRVVDIFLSVPSLLYPQRRDSWSGRRVWVWKDHLWQNLYRIV